MLDDSELAETGPRNLFMAAAVFMNIQPGCLSLYLDAHDQTPGELLPWSQKISLPHRLIPATHLSKIYAVFPTQAPADASQTQ